MFQVGKISQSKRSQWKILSSCSVISVWSLNVCVIRAAASIIHVVSSLSKSGIGNGSFAHTGAFITETARRGNNHRGVNWTKKITRRVYEALPGGNKRCSPESQKSPTLHLHTGPFITETLWRGNNHKSVNRTKKLPSKPIKHGGKAGGLPGGNKPESKKSSTRCRRIFKIAKKKEFRLIGLSTDRSRDFTDASFSVPASKGTLKGSDQRTSACWDVWRREWAARSYIYSSD